METDTLLPDQALEALAHCYTEYAPKLKQAYASGGLSDTLSCITGGGRKKYEREQVLTAYHTDIAGCVAALCDVLQHAAKAEGNTCASAALEYLMFYPLTGDNLLDLSFAAIEGLAEPLLLFLPHDALADAFARYQKRTPPRRMLPNQKHLYQRMKQLLTD